MPRPVALATMRSLPRLYADDAPLLRALDAAGLRGEPVVWDSAADWGAFACVMIRSTWDYPQRHAEFLAWLDRLESRGVPVWNPLRVLRWNSDKRYLRDLAARGAPTVPTRVVEPGQAASLAGVLDEEGWGEAVVKPMIGAAGKRVFRVARREAAARQADFARLAERGALVQPFVPEIAQGEVSFVFLGGEFSHAVLKRPCDGEFRVQLEHGGSHEPARVAPEHVAQARAALDAVGEPLLYARVDGVLRAGQLLLMELEALEPELFFLKAPGSAARCAEALRERL